MLNRVDPKTKDDGASSVVEDTDVVTCESGEVTGDEVVNANTIDKSVEPETEEPPLDADEKSSDKEEEKEAGEEDKELGEEEEKESGEEDKELGEEEKESGEKDKEVGEEDKEPGEGVQLESSGRNDKEAEETGGTPKQLDNIKLRRMQRFGDDGAMQPLKFNFTSNPYHKGVNLSGKCYIDSVLTNIQRILKQKEEWMGMWILILRSASTAKKNELWFIVNGVPIRYSLREFRLISGLYCHEYPANYERLGGTSFMNKYFDGKKVTYAEVEKQMLEMKGKPSLDRQKMAVLYFLASILVGGRKTGEGASPVDSFFLTVVDDLDACLKFPWGRYAFEHNLKDVFSFLEKCKGDVPTSWVFTSFPVPFDVFSSSSCS